MKEALRAAAEVLRAFEAGELKGSVQTALRRSMDRVPDRGRPLVSRWGSGALRHRYSLKALVGAVARRAFKSARPDFVALLLLGAWRLVLGDELAKVTAEARSQASGKGQGEDLERALGAFAGSFSREPWRDGPLSEAELASGAYLPLPGGRFLVFEKPLFELKGRSPAGRLALLYSLPEELCRGWIEDLGWERAREVAAACNDDAPIFARTQMLKIRPADLIEKLENEGITARIAGSEWPAALELCAGREKFQGTESFKSGYYSIQDLTSQDAPLKLSPPPGAEVLDLCAAPGGKSCYLAELMEDRGRVLAVDRKPGRLRKIGDAVARLGLSCVETRLADGREGDFLGGAKFQFVLLDAPCSNTGVLRRRPEARWRYESREQKRFVRDQRGLIEVAAETLAPGGRLLYSVCSVEKEEGAELVRWLLGLRPDLELADEMQRWPAIGGGDGGYQALILRR